MSETSQKIEALIFASSKPVSENEIKKRLDIHEDISEVMSNLETAYQHRGINLKKISNKWIFLTNTEVSEIFHEKKEIQKRLSKQAIETLAKYTDEQNIHRYLLSFADRKMWDSSWDPLVHVDYRDHIFVDDEKGHLHPKQAKSQMSIEKMNVCYSSTEAC